MKWWYFAGGLALGAGAMYALRRTWKFGPLTVGPALGDLGAADPSGVPSALPSSIANALATHVRQIRRYAFAASQDKSPTVGITHASYALVLLDTLEEVAGRDAITKAGYDAGKLRKFITELQDMHAKKLQACDQHLQQVLAIEKAEGGVPTPGAVAGADIGDGWGAPLGA